MVRRLWSLGLALIVILVALPTWAADELLSVRVATANFREGPSTRHDILFTADRFYPVKVLERQSGWCRIKDFEGDVAWVAERLLARVRTIVIKVSHANIREKPTTRANILYKTEMGEALRVLDRDGQWLNVMGVNGEKGWVHENLAWGMKGKPD